MLRSPICPLANYYQFFREVIFALHNKGIFVLLYDERNPVFMRRSTHDGSTLGLWPFLQTFIPKSKRDRISAVTIQQVVAAITASGRHNDWIGEFRAKYGM
ncbi:MAG: PGN_0703 family putative restriction endonuclease [Syntrophomonadaceae bacterium]